MLKEQMASGGISAAELEGEDIGQVCPKSSYDERTETSLYKPVMHVIEGEQSYQFVKLTLESGEFIETTAEHPFYIQGKGWNAANTIKVGEALRLHNGTVVVVSTVDTSVRMEKVYNLTVAQTHNYFVGRDGVLVHNCLEVTSRIKESQRLIKEAEKAAKSHQKSLNQLTAELLKGNMNPGTGSKHIGKGVYEARAKDGARVYFQNTDNGIEILGKSNKANQQQVIDAIFDTFRSE